LRGAATLQAGQLGGDHVREIEELDKADQMQRFRDAVQGNDPIAVKEALDG
jgi:hypothetical protein